MKKKIIISFIFLLFTISNCFAYEIVKAKTVVDKDVFSSQKATDKNYRPTFNDPDVPNFSNDDSVSTLLEKKVTAFFEKRKRKKSQVVSEDDIEEATEEKPIIKDVEEETVSDKNKFKINADAVSYDESDGNIYATGHVEIISKEHGITIKSDEAVLDKSEQKLKLFGNVKILKNNIEMTGEYMVVDLNEENILMDNPTIDAYAFIINAQEARIISNDLEAVNGTVKSMKGNELSLETRGFMRLDNSLSYFKEARKKYIDSENPQDKNKHSYRIDAKEIVFNSFKDHNSVVLKGSNIYFDNHKIIPRQDIEIISDKEQTVNDVNAPEFGSVRGFGTFIGYSFIQKLPKGQILKLMPALVYGDSNIGVGLVARHRSKNSSIQAGWSTSTTNLVGTGVYKFSDAFKLRYGRNAYMPEGFMGARRSGYAAQFEYEKTYKNTDLDLTFNHGFYAGVFSEYKKHDQEHAFATTRFRYIAEMRKDFLKYRNKEQDLDIILSGLAQTAFTVYGCGDTAGVARIGPMITTRLRRWESSLAYMLTGVHGDSPFYFDKYRYGQSTIMLNERFNFNDKLAVGYRAFVTPMKDNLEKDLLTESRFYAIFGPRDLKVAVSYDFVRDAGYVDFMFMVGGNSTKIDFEKMTTNNMDGGNQKRDFYRTSRKIDIENPDTI